MPFWKRPYLSFERLAEELREDGTATFTQRWQNPSWQASLPAHFRGAAVDFPGQGGSIELPRYLYRGEAGVYPESRSSWSRMIDSKRFGPYEFELISALKTISYWVTNRYIGNPSRAAGFAQHYGFPTRYLDVSSDPLVALHFAASTRSSQPLEKRVVWRLDLQGLDKDLYVEGADGANLGSAGDQAPISVARLEQLYFVRAQRQRAWVISAQTDDTPFNLQRSRYLRKHLKRFTVLATDADDFVQPTLEDAESDGFAPWPLAMIRALKVVAGGALPRTVAEWMCDRIPLYEWTPVIVRYDGLGRGIQIQYFSSAEAKAEHGRDYGADRNAIIEELVDPEVRLPNGLVFGQASGGIPGTAKRFNPGDEIEVQWAGSIPKPIGPSHEFPHNPNPVPFEKQYGVWRDYARVVLR